MRIAMSGGFDPPHIGHYKMFEAAYFYKKDPSNENTIIIILNSDSWLMRKKGYIFMPYEEREFILSCCKYSNFIITANDADDTVVNTLRLLKPDIFANGGDRTKNNTPEMELCNELGIEMIWNLGGEKIQSSSELINNTIANKNKGI